MWVKLCASSRGDHILRLVAPWRLHPAAGAPINHGDDILWFLAASPSESHPLLLCLLLCLLFCLLLCFLFYGRRMEK